MDKYILDKKGRAEEYIQGIKGKREIHFPLCLEFKVGSNATVECPDFLMNTTKGELFIPANLTLPVGTSMLLNFYIPPRTKLLVEFTGKVVGEGIVNSIKGNSIALSDFSHKKLHMLEDYLEEKQHLVDEIA